MDNHGLHDENNEVTNIWSNQNGNRNISSVKNVANTKLDQINEPQNYNSNEEELLKSFIGKNYNKITTKRFNFSGFFFSSLYMFYRKMILYGLLAFILEFLLINLIGLPDLVMYVLFHTILGFLVNKVYLFYANAKIKKIKNTRIDWHEQNSLCLTKGGTSVESIFLGGFFNNNLSNGTYNGGLSYDTSIQIKNEFTISVPSQFENKSSKYEYEYSYESDNGVFDKCSVELNAIKGYINGEDLINQMANYGSDEKSDVTKASINQID